MKNDPCVNNNKTPSGQVTLRTHADDLKISYKEVKEIVKVIDQFKDIYNEIILYKRNELTIWVYCGPRVLCFNKDLIKKLGYKKITEAQCNQWNMDDYTWEKEQSIMTLDTFMSRIFWIEV